MLLFLLLEAEMKHAKKLPFTFENGVNALNAFKRLRVLDAYGKNKNTGKYSITKKYIPKKAVHEFKQVIPEELMPHLLGIIESEISSLAPHVHTEEQCVINFYKNTNQEVTSMYEGRIEKYEDNMEDNGNGYYLVNPHLLEKTEEFVAKDGDVWLLNTRQPHSVQETATISGKPRTVIQAFFDIPYEKAAKLL